jgi:hypothetical protein
VAVVFIADIPTMTSAMYGQAINRVRDQLKAAPGFLAHSGTATQNGFRVIELWESQDQCMRFLEETIMPMAQQVGVPPFQPQFFEADEAFIR